MLIILSPATDYAPITMLYLTFMIYSLIKILEYFLTKPKDDYEELYTTIVCAIAAFSGFKYIDYNPPMVLSLTLAVWVCAMAIIKLIKIDCNYFLFFSLKPYLYLSRGDTDFALEKGVGNLTGKR